MAATLCTDLAGSGRHHEPDRHTGRMRQRVSRRIAAKKLDLLIYKSTRGRHRPHRLPSKDFRVR